MSAVREALEFYAEERRYDYDNDCVWDPPLKKHIKELQLGVLEDNGERAREALSALDAAGGAGDDWDALRGAAPDATGKKSSEEFIRNQRDDWYGDSPAPVAGVGVPTYCRPEVLMFAILMERELRNNDHKAGWKADDPRDLLEHLEKEISERLARVLERMGE